MARPRHDRSGAGPWLRRWWRALLSEVCATALLVGLGLAGAVPLDGAPPPPLAHVAFSFGFVVAGCCVAFGSSSGAHMNPSVSLAAALAGRLAWGTAAAYALAQTAGALLGFAALQSALPAAARVAATEVARGVAPAAAVAVEAAATGLLALASCAAWAAHDPRRPDPALPATLGLLVAGLVFAAGGATGASLNPARSLAPALLLGRWTLHWVYWLGPLAGAALAALLHTYVLSPRPPSSPAPASTPEDVPLDDKP